MPIFGIVRDIYAIATNEPTRLARTEFQEQGYASMTIDELNYQRRVYSGGGWDGPFGRALCTLIDQELSRRNNAAIPA